MSCWLRQPEMIASFASQGLRPTQNRDSLVLGPRSGLTPRLTGQLKVCNGFHLMPWETILRAPRDLRVWNAEPAITVLKLASNNLTVGRQSWLVDLELSLLSCDTVASQQRRDSGNKRISNVMYRYQATACEFIAHCMCGLVTVTGKVCEWVRLGIGYLRQLISLTKLNIWQMIVQPKDERGSVCPHEIMPNSFHTSIYFSLAIFSIATYSF